MNITAGKFKGKKIIAPELSKFISVIFKKSTACTSSIEFLNKKIKNKTTIFIIFLNVFFIRLPIMCLYIQGRLKIICFQ